MSLPLEARSRYRASRSGSASARAAAQFRVERGAADLIEVDAGQEQRIGGDARRHILADAGRRIDGAARNGGGRQRNERRPASEVDAIHHVL